MRHLRLTGCALLLTGLATAQSTWIVDAQNGPGAHFTDLPPAVAAASAGDVIVVRYVDPLVTAYTAPTVDKGLTIVSAGGGRPGVTGMFSIGAVPAGERVVVRGVQLAPFATANGISGDCFLRVLSNGGTVHFEDVMRDQVTTLAYTTNGMLLMDTPLVTFHRCSLPKVTSQSIFISDCDEVVLDQCSIGVQSLGQTQPTVWLTRSRLVLLDSTILGAGSPFPISPALGACDAAIELAGPNAAVVAPGLHSAIVDGYGGLGCVGSSTLVVGPGALVLPGGPVPTTLGPVFGLGGYVDGNGTLDLDVYGHSNGIAVLSFGAPSPTPAPLWGSTYYLDLPTVVAFDAVLLGQTSTATWSAQLPTGLPPGVSLWLQAASIGANGDFRLSTPAVVTTP